MVCSNGWRGRHVGSIQRLPLCNVPRSFGIWYWISFVSLGCIKWDSMRILKPTVHGWSWKRKPLNHVTVWSPLVKQASSMAETLDGGKRRVSFPKMSFDTAWFIEGSNGNGNWCNWPYSPICFSIFGRIDSFIVQLLHPVFSGIHVAATGPEAANVARAAHSRWIWLEAWSIRDNTDNLSYWNTHQHDLGIEEGHNSLALDPIMLKSKVW